MQVGLLRPFIGKLLDTGQLFSFLLALFDTLLQGFRRGWVLVEIVIQLFCHEVVNKILHGSAPFHHILAAKLRLGLGLEHRLYHPHRYGGGNALTDIRSVIILFIKIPDEIKGVKLDDAQKQTLLEGKPLQLEGMISKKGTEFNATVQFNADKRYVEFMFDRSNTNQQAQVNKQTQGNQQTQAKEQNPSQEAPKTFRGKELDNEQYNKFKDGQTIYVSGLVDKKGKEYNGYITYNKESGKTGFEFPNQYKERTQPTEAHKTQTAVNSEGKTNEATQNIKEPLQKGQQTPKDKKQQEQQEKPKAPAKSKGRKM